MTGLVRLVRKLVDSECVHSGPLKKDGCSVSLQKAPKCRLIIDFDRPGSPLGPSEKRCDYLIIAKAPTGSDWVAPLELKKGDLDASQVIAQLQAGANAAERIVDSNAAVTFRPVAAYGRKFHKSQRPQIKRDKVRFFKQKESVRVVKCGSYLINALKAAS